MRRRFLMFLLAVGTVVGYGSGFAHMAHSRWQGHCHGWDQSYYGQNGYDGDQQQPVQQVAPQKLEAPAPVVQQPPAQQQQSPVIVVQPPQAPAPIIVQVPVAQPNAQSPVIVQVPAQQPAPVQQQPAPTTR